MTENSSSSRDNKARWPPEALRAAIKLRNEYNSWGMIALPFTRLAVENGWGNSSTWYDIYQAVQGRNVSTLLQLYFEYLLFQLYLLAAATL